MCDGGGGDSGGGDSGGGDGGWGGGGGEHYVRSFQILVTTSLLLSLLTDNLHLFQMLI